MSINSGYKLYEVFKIEESKNELLEPVDKLVFFKLSLINLNDSTKILIDNNIRNVYIELNGITKDKDIKDNMIIKFEDKLFTVEHSKRVKEKIILKLKEYGK